MIGIGTAAPFQARRLMDGSIPFELLLDPQRRLYEALGLRTQSLGRFVFNLRAWLRWVRSFLVRGQGRITGHYSVLPGVAIVDATGDVAYLYRGSGLGDYPDLDEVLDRLQGATRNI